MKRLQRIFAVVLLSLGPWLGPLPATQAQSEHPNTVVEQPSAKPAGFTVIRSATGKLVFVRVHEIGTGYGPGTDFLDGEVVFRLNTELDKAFGFQLRNDANRPVRQGMLDVLRDAFANNDTITVEYISDDEFPKKNNIIFRLIATK